MKPVVSVLFVFVHLSLKCQISHQLRLQYEAPIQMGVGYQYSFTDRVSVFAQAGYLGEPNSSFILESLAALGVDDPTVALIENTFSSGWVSKLGFNYHLSQWYFSLYGMHLALTGGETTEVLLASILDITLPARARLGTGSDLVINTHLFQLGAGIGRYFMWNEKNGLFVEIGLSTHLGSKSALSSVLRDLTSASALLDDYLKSIYKGYAHIPSLSVGYAFRF